MAFESLGIFVWESFLNGDYATLSSILGLPYPPSRALRLQTPQVPLLPKMTLEEQRSEAEAALSAVEPLGPHRCLGVLEAIREIGEA